MIFSYFYILLLALNKCEYYPDALPRKATLQKVNQNVSDCFQIVSSTLLDPQMSIYWGISSGPCQASIFFVWNVLMCFEISVFFAQTEINAVQNMWIFSDSNQKILWLNVSVDVIFCMKELHFLDLSYSKSTIWSASMSTVLRLNFLVHAEKRSSRLGPSNSMTTTLQRFSHPNHYILGNPTY